MEDQLFNKAELIFSNRFRAATKGSTRPEICAMDWNWNCKSKSAPFDGMVALSSAKLTRVFGLNGNAWKMLMNRRTSGSRSINALKWTPRNSSYLAIASGDGHNVTIDLLKFKGGHFRRIKRFLVADAGGVSSLSWNNLGNYLVAAIKRDAYHPQAQMLVTQKLKKKKYNQWRIDCDYQSAFTAKFHTNRTFILSVSVKSTEISLWDKNDNHEWQVLSLIPCDVGITDMCMDFTGLHIAAIVGKRLMIWKCCDVSSDGNLSSLELEEIQYQNEDGVKRKKSESLQHHCANIISLGWSREGLLLTGSSRGTFCVHGQPMEDDEGQKKSTFEVVYFRFSYVHAYNKDGPVTCVAWIPFEPWKLAVAGNDGVAIVWELADSKSENKHDRNYMKEVNYFYPGRRVYSRVSSAVLQDFDVASIESIQGSGSEPGSEDDLSEGEEGSVEVQSALQSSRVRKVIQNQASMKESLNKVLGEIQDASLKLDTLQLLAEERDKKISGLVDDVDKIKEKQGNGDLEEMLESLLRALHQIRRKMHEVLKGINNGKTAVLGRMNLLEEALKKQKAVENALQKLKEQEHMVKVSAQNEDVFPTGVLLEEVSSNEETTMMQVLTTTQQVLLKLAEDRAQVNKAAEEVLAKVNFLEEKAKGDKEAGDELLSQVKQVISKQNVIESSIQSLQQNLDTKFLLKQNQLELSFTQKKNHLEEFGRVDPKTNNPGGGAQPE